MKRTEEELARLIEQYLLTGEAGLREQIIEHYLPLAKAVASRFTGRGVEFDDLFQVASLAMLKALDRFDINGGAKFNTYATQCMIGEIRNYFRDTSRMVRISRRDAEKLTALNKLLGEAGQENRTPEQIAKELDITVEHLAELLEMRQNATPASLDKSISDDGEDTLGQFLGCEEQGYDEIIRNDLIRQVFSLLDEEEKQLIRLRFWENLSQQQTAKKLGVSQMTVSRQEKKILSKLKNHLK